MRYSVVEKKNMSPTSISDARYARWLTEQPVS